ncbi:MAG: sulfatase-like hydrolase/transferase [Planctomycetota bacterium]
MKCSRIALSAVVVWVAAWGWPSPSTASAGPPNIVIILADDLGWNSVGYHNPKVHTPHLDQLCKEGIELDQFYVSPMCTPTRAGLLTGRYPIRFGLARAVIPPWRDFGLPTDEITLADALDGAGYENRGVFGKWHLGHQRKRWLPLQRGFTEFEGCLNGAIDYFELERDDALDWHEGNQLSESRGYSTRLIGQAAADFISRAAKDETPFLCYVPFNAPHSPFQAPEKELAMYADVKNEVKRTYYAMISVMDQEIGRILRAIDESGVRDETLVWFMSDNGGVRSIKGNNTPLHGAKLTTFEGGVRSVACVRYPGVYAAGRTLREPTAFIDVMPTLLPLANVDSHVRGRKKLDGVNLHPLLSGAVAEAPNRDLYFYHGQSGEQQEPMAIISGQWKLVVIGPRLSRQVSQDHEVMLYDLKRDPNESNDVAEAHPDVVGALMGRLVEFRNLQPENGVAVYREGRDDYVPPRDWHPKED